MEQTITVKFDTSHIDSVVRNVIANIIKDIVPAKYAPVATQERPDLNEGEHYAGLILGKDGEADCHLILLPDEAIDINWQDAKAWAAEQGGELPSRREQSLLFANLKEHFKPRWHWSCEEHSEHAHYAWLQYFTSGFQNYSDKDDEICARAVRRVSVI